MTAKRDSQKWTARATDWRSIPRPYLVLYLALSALLNILGIASIAEGIVSWAGFIAHAINIYHQFLRDPIVNVVLHFWPVTWPKFPRWVVDLFIIQSSFFISYSLFMAFERGRYDITFRETRTLQPLLIFLGGPVVPFFQLMRLRRIGRREINLAKIEAKEGEAAEAHYAAFGNMSLPLLSEEGWIALDKRQLAGFQAAEAASVTFKRLNLYYLCYLASVVIILFVAYQFGQIK